MKIVLQPVYGKAIGTLRPCKVFVVLPPSDCNMNAGRLKVPCGSEGANEEDGDLRLNEPDQTGRRAI